MYIRYPYAKHTVTISYIKKACARVYIREEHEACRLLRNRGNLASSVAISTGFAGTSENEPKPHSQHMIFSR